MMQWPDCPECNGPTTGGVTYTEVRDGNYRTEWELCDRCRTARRTYAGYSVFSYDQTGPGDCLRDYKVVLCKAELEYLTQRLREEFN